MTDGNNSIYGTLPRSISTLLHLKRFFLQRSPLVTGLIPNEFTEMVNLEFLQLHGNQHTGTLPHHIGNMTNLRQIDLERNLINGSFPVSIVNCTRLESIGLDGMVVPANPYNRMTGPIPELSHFPNIYYFSVSNNKLTGHIPRSVSNATKLEILSFSGNQMEGARELWFLLIVDVN